MKAIGSADSFSRYLMKGPMYMDLRDFKYLIALEEEGSVSKAAERLYMAQSSLSQFLQQTESELGVKLFLRTSKGIRPTPNGEIFIGHLKKILADYRMARGELWDSEGMKGGRVTFGISSFRGQQTLPQILLRFARQYPEVKVRVVEANSRRLEELLLEGKLDVAVVALPAAKLKNEAHFLKKEELYLVSSCNHPVKALAHPMAEAPGQWVSLKEAAGFNFVLSDQDTMMGSISRDLFQKHKLKISSSQDTITAAMAVSMAKAGVGLAFTYASCVDPDEPMELFRIGEKGVFLELGVALPTREYHSTASRELARVIREVYSGE